MAKLKWNPPDLSNMAIARHAYTKDYAAEVHDGLTRDTARPWVETTVLEFDFAQAIADELVNAPITRATFVQAWQAANEELGNAFDDAMNDQRWAWPRTTVRSTGEVAGTVRNIVDTGELRDSRELDFR